MSCIAHCSEHALSGAGLLHAPPGQSMPYTPTQLSRYPPTVVTCVPRLTLCPPLVPVFSDAAALLREQPCSSGWAATWCRRGPAGWCGPSMWRALSRCLPTTAARTTRSSSSEGHLGQCMNSAQCKLRFFLLRRGRTWAKMPCPGLVLGCQQSQLTLCCHLQDAPSWSCHQHSASAEERPLVSCPAACPPAYLPLPDSLCPSAHHQPACLPACPPQRSQMVAGASLSLLKPDSCSNPHTGQLPQPTKASQLPPPAHASQLPCHPCSRLQGP